MSNYNLSRCMTKGKVRTSKENTKAQIQQNIYAFNF